mgnify:FL=1
MSKINNTEVLEQILTDKDKRELLAVQVKRLATDKELLKNKQDVLNDDIKQSASDLGVTNSKLNELIKIYADSLEDSINEMSTMTHVLKFIQSEFS